MSSVVFYKFKNQKDQKRVAFDGTGISVFELKAAIIKQSGLGDGFDFDFDIETSDDSSEGRRTYDDDTEIVFRGTTVVARRSPAARPRQGRAARYVSGKAPVVARTQPRMDGGFNPAIPSKASTGSLSATMSEDKKIAAMFDQGASQYQQQQEAMASERPVFRGNAKGPVNVPKGEPPEGYRCHRCSMKGHWIQACPNDTGDSENRHKFKKTTGIPRSFLQVLDKPEAMGEDGSVDMSKLPAGVMYTSTGEWVVAKPDQASWEQFQDKAKAAKEKAEAQLVNNQQVADLGLECPLDKRLFVDPVKTPCCGQTYCRDCIENSLLSNDFVCPGCSAVEVLVDNLTVDEEKAEAAAEFLKSRDDKTPPQQQDEQIANEETKATTVTSTSQSPTASKSLPTATDAAALPTVAPNKDTSTAPGTPASASETAQTLGSRKRPAEDSLDSKRVGSGPPAITTNPPISPAIANAANNMMDFGFLPNMTGPNMPMMAMGMPPMGMPMGMGMGMGMGMPPMGMPNPMMMAMMNGMMPTMPMNMPMNNGFQGPGRGRGAGRVYGQQWQRGRGMPNQQFRHGGQQQHYQQQHQSQDRGRMDRRHVGGGVSSPSSVAAPATPAPAGPAGTASAVSKT